MTDNGDLDSVAPLSTDEREALDGLTAGLRRVFGTRLHSVSAYGLHEPSASPRAVHSIALVERLTFQDLSACAPLTVTWRRTSLAVPLILEREEFLRTLDVFPLEYGDIIAQHVVIAGSDPFVDARVSPADIRRACELSAKSHLIHLREGFLETGGDAPSVARLIAASAGPFRALLANIARLADDRRAFPQGDRRAFPQGDRPAFPQGDRNDDVAQTAERQIGIPASVVRDVIGAGSGTQSSITDPTATLSRYIAAVEKVWEYVDTWRTRA